MKKTFIPLSDAEQARLDVLEKRYKSGDGMALFETIEECALHGWLLPAWAHGEFLAGLARYRRGTVKDFGDSFNLPKKDLHKANRAALMPLAGGMLLMPVNEYVLKHVPVKPSMVESWEDLAEAIAKNFQRIGWPPPKGLSKRTLQRIWADSKK